MRMAMLGESGIEASVVGLGAWAIGGWMWGGQEESEAIATVHAALDHGITLIDTAPVYGFGRSEEVVGKALRGRRERVVLATKCGLVWHVAKGEHHFDSDEKMIQSEGGPYHVYKYLGRDTIRYEIEQSLKRLKTDYIDLYQTHWQDPTTPIEETMEALLRLKDEGKIRAIGASNAKVEQMEAYRRVGPVASDQERYSMLDRQHEKDLLPYCAEKKIAFLAYSPMARGLLTGKVGPEREFAEGDARAEQPRFSVENRKRVQRLLDALRPVAERHTITLANLAAAWAIHQKGCSHALVGARTAAQAIENAAIGNVRFLKEDIEVMADVLETRGKDIV